MDKLTADDVFRMWKVETKELGANKYAATERVELIDMLCELLRKYGIDIDDARFLKKKVIEVLVTKEGMKGSGKYKGWKETTENEFLDNLLVYYVDDFEIVNSTEQIKNSKSRNQYYGEIGYMDRTQLIVEWTKFMFKKKWTESICLEAHKIGSSLWLLFEKEVMNSKWSKTGKRPSWAKNV